MGVDLELNATRFITVNKTGKVETQSYSIQVVNFNRDKCELIINANDPYKEYCKLVTEEFTDLIPIYNWDNKVLPVEEDLSVEHIENMYGLDEIIGYQTQAKCIIDSLDVFIKDTLDRGYELEWSISY